MLDVQCDGVAATHRCFAPGDDIAVFASGKGGAATPESIEGWRMKSMREQRRFAWPASYLAGPRSRQEWARYSPGVIRVRRLNTRKKYDGSS